MCSKIEHMKKLMHLKVTLQWANIGQPILTGYSFKTKYFKTKYLLLHQINILHTL